MPLTSPDSFELCRVAAMAAADKKADRPVILDVGRLLGIVDAFVICSAGNDRQVRTIAEEVERRVKEESGESPLRVEGKDEAAWILLDYGDMVVHVFLDEWRAYYDLERLWKDAARVEWDVELVAGEPRS
ncbi:MAG: ribosome silencing factor [Acidimicrobiales bacterium]